MGFIWGIPYLFIKIAVGELAPSTVVLGRTAIAAALLVPIALARGGFRPLLPHWRLLLVYSLVEIIGPWFFLTHAEERITSSLAGLLIAGVPLVGALIAWRTDPHERPDTVRALGLLVGFLGVGLVVGFNVASDDLIAVVDVALVVVGYAVGAMLIGRMRELPTLSVIAASLALAAAVYLVPGIAQLPTSLPSPQAIAAVIVLGVVCTAVAFLVFFALIREVGPNRATVITYVNPAVAVVLGVLILAEPFTPTIALGFALIALGSFLGTRRARPASDARPLGSTASADSSSAADSR